MHIHFYLYLYLYIYIYIYYTYIPVSLCFLHSFGGSLRSAEVESACKDLEKLDCVKDLRAVLATNEAESSLCCFFLELVVSLPRKTKEVQKPEFKRKETSKILILPSTLLQVCLWLGVMSRQHSLLQTRQHSLLQTMLVPKKDVCIRNSRFTLPPVAPLARHGLQVPVSLSYAACSRTVTPKLIWNHSQKLWGHRCFRRGWVCLTLLLSRERSN